MRCAMRRAMRRTMRRDETFHVWTTGSRTGSRSATEVYRPQDCPSIVDRTKLHFLSSGLSVFLLTLNHWNSTSIQIDQSNPIHIAAWLDPTHPGPLQIHPLQIASNP